MAVRKSAHFGRFFLACFACSAGTRPVRYFALGSLPAAPSLTPRPRNAGDIEAFVRASTGNRAFALPDRPNKRRKKARQ